MLTLTSNGLTPSVDTYKIVARQKYISRLMRRLCITRWVAVLEFQEETQQPHWHVLYDATDLPSRQINLKLAWHLWRDTWYVGGLDLSREKPFQSREQALSCISSYLIKRPEAYPEWVLKTPGIRFVNASKAVGSVVSKTKAKSNTEARPRHASARTRKYAPRRTPAQRMAECGQSSKLIQEVIDGPTGELRRVYIATLPASPEKLRELSETGELLARMTTIEVDGRDVIRMLQGDAIEIRERLLNRWAWMRERRERREAKERALLGTEPHAHDDPSRPSPPDPRR